MVSTSAISPFRSKPPTVVPQDHKTPKMLKIDSKRDSRKDPSKFTLNLSETKMKTAFPENENSVS